MKLRSLGTGSITCRHPLTTASFLLQAEGANIVIGCGAGIPAKLESINVDPTIIDIWVPLHTGVDQWAGLEEIAHMVQMGTKKPFVAAPQPLIDYISARMRERFGGRSVLEFKPTQRIRVAEEHHDEELVFIHNFGTSNSFALSLEQCAVLISGSTELNEEWLHAHGSDSQVILHSCHIDNGINLPGEPPSLEILRTLPVYIQRKIWLYGYDNTYQDVLDPIPMLFLPYGQWIYDSSRRDKHLDKERFIRENTKRQEGNAFNKALHLQGRD